MSTISIDDQKAGGSAQGAGAEKPKQLRGAAKKAAEAKAAREQGADDGRPPRKSADGGKQSPGQSPEEQLKNLQAENERLTQELKKRPKQVHSQTAPSDSRALATLDRVNWFYLRVASDPVGEEPIHLDEYLDKPSPSDPSKPMWEIFAKGDTSEGRALTGSKKMVMLRCSIEDKRIEMKRDMEAAGLAERARSDGVGAKNVPGEIEEFEDFKGGVNAAPAGLIRL